MGDKEILDVQIRFELHECGRHQPHKKLYAVNENEQYELIAEFTGANFSHKHDYFAQQVTGILNRHVGELDGLQAVSLFI